MRGFRAGPPAIGAEFPTGNLQLGVLAINRFFERDLQIVLQIAAAFGPASWSPSSGLAEEIFEDVVEDIAESAAAEVESIGSWLGTCMAERIVALPFLLIAESLVGFVDLLEFFFGGLFF